VDSVGNVYLAVEINFESDFDPEWGDYAAVIWIQGTTFAEE
jgi:hypothetical protein